LEYWTSIKASTRVADFESYLQKFPNGEFADLAKSKVVTLRVFSVPVLAAAPKGTSPLGARPPIDPSLLPDEPPVYSKPPGEVTTDISQNRPRPLVQQ